MKSSHLIAMSLATAITAITASSPPALKWTYTNPFTNSPTDPLAGPFTITTPPETDIWRPTFALDNFTAPSLSTTLPTHSFHRLRATFSASWKTQYDQGGLILTFPPSASSSPSTSSSPTTPLRYIKAGIEFFEGAPNLGVVATDRLSDWSLSPLPVDAGGMATIEIERDGTDAWVYVVEGGGGRRALRQVTWAFGEGVGEDVGVGVYAAKPTYDGPEVGGDGQLVVRFEGVGVEVRGEGEGEEGFEEVS